MFIWATVALRTLSTELSKRKKKLFHSDVTNFRERSNRNRWQLSSLTWPSRGARKLKHSFNITGTWTVWESPWVQKHRSFWYGNINRLLAQYKDKGLAAILLVVQVIYEAASFWWRSTADMIYRSPKRAHFQNGDCQSTPRWPSGKIARRTQSLEARSSKGR